jgi:hypothetical protein
MPAAVLGGGFGEHRRGRARTAPGIPHVPRVCLGVVDRVRSVLSDRAHLVHIFDERLASVGYSPAQRDRYDTAPRVGLSIICWTSSSVRVGLQRARGLTRSEACRPRLGWSFGSGSPRHGGELRLGWVLAGRHLVAAAAPGASIDVDEYDETKVQAAVRALVPRWWTGILRSESGHAARSPKCPNAAESVCIEAHRAGGL